MGVLQPLARLALRYSTRTGLYTLHNLVPATELRGNKLKESANKDLDADSHPSSNTSL